MILDAFCCQSAVFLVNYQLQVNTIHSFIVSDTISAASYLLDCVRYYFIFLVVCGAFVWIFGIFG